MYNKLHYYEVVNEYLCNTLLNFLIYFLKFVRYSFIQFKVYARVSLQNKMGCNYFIFQKSAIYNDMNDNAIL